MKKLTLKEMTAFEQLEVKTQLGKARVNLGRTLTNSEQNKIKDAIVSDIMQKRAELATVNRSKRKGAKTTSSTTTFNWSDSISTRPLR